MAKVGSSSVLQTVERRSSWSNYVVASVRFYARVGHIHFSATAALLDVEQMCIYVCLEAHRIAQVRTSCVLLLEPPFEAMAPERSCDVEGLALEWDGQPSIREALRAGGVFCAEVSDKGRPEDSIQVCRCPAPYPETNARR